MALFFLHDIEVATYRPFGEHKFTRHIMVYFESALEEQ